VETVEAAGQHVHRRKKDQRHLFRGEVSVLVPHEH